MSEPTAAVFPRYFRHRDGFSDDTILIRFADGFNWGACVHERGFLSCCCGIYLRDVEQLVADGVWIEVPRGEADAMIRKGRGE